MAAAAPDDPGRAGYLSNLGNALLTRFERNDTAVDLDRAVEVGQAAVAAVSDASAFDENVAAIPSTAAAFFQTPTSVR